MAIAIDLILLAIMLLSIFLGYKKGLIGVAFKILSFIIAIVITLILYNPVSSYIINNTQIDENIESIIVEKLGANTKIEEGEIIKQDSDLPSVIVNYINDTIKNTVNESKEAIIKAVSRDLTINIIRIIVIIVLFLLTKIILFFAKAILELVTEIPIIKEFNEIGGIIYGIIRGILFIYIILAILTFILPMLNSEIILKAINDTIITKVLYNNNLILKLLL